MSELKTIDYINQINNIIHSNKRLACYVFVKKYDIEELIDKIYSSVPVEIMEAKALGSKTGFGEYLYNELKNFEVYLDNSLKVFNFCILNINKTEQLLRKIAENISSGVR